MISNNEILKMIFGFKLRYLRLKKNKSYQELSELSGLSTSYLSDIEKGKKYPKPDKIQLLAKGFDISYDEMVSTRSDKKIQPVIDLIRSDFFKFFPSEALGISPGKVIEMFTKAPDKTNAFISTVLKIIRSYRIDKEDFYRVALRSYQDIHDNYFPDIEHCAQRFREEYGVKLLKPKPKKLEQLLRSLYDIRVNYEKLSSVSVLQKVRSFFESKNRILYIHDGLNENQKVFLLLKELGTQFMNLEERPHETVLNKEASFEKLLSNFKASYFAIALMIDERTFVKDIKKIAELTTWEPASFQALLEKYDVTPEMLLQRLTNILPSAFGITHLFFIKLAATDKRTEYRMTKELHLSQIHNPYSNRLNEHLCQRWVSIGAMKALRSDAYVIDAQVSQYLDHPNAYLCITIAQRNSFDYELPSSVTIGLLMNQELKAAFNFLKDDSIKKKIVHTTCERCSVADCKERAAQAFEIDREAAEEELRQALKGLSGSD